jgi:hypothetical protein
LKNATNEHTGFGVFKQTKGVNFMASPAPPPNLKRNPDSGLFLKSPERIEPAGAKFKTARMDLFKIKLQSRLKSNAKKK